METYVGWWCQTFVLIFYAYCELYRETELCQNISCKCSYGRMNCAEMERLHLAIPDISESITGNHSIQRLSTHQFEGLTTLASSLGLTAADRSNNSAKPRELIQLLSCKQEI